MFVSSVVTRPSDGKGDNYMVTTSAECLGVVHSAEREASNNNHFIIGIDNDIQMLLLVTLCTLMHVRSCIW
jgi:hypothetical protein